MAYRSSLIVVVVTLALMPVLTSDAGWAALRFVAGCASALVFMAAASALLTGGCVPAVSIWPGTDSAASVPGSPPRAYLCWFSTAPGRTPGWSAALLGAVLVAAAWPLRQSAAGDDGTDRGAGPGRRWLTLLPPAYTLEGIGYIIAGTFLVAAIDQTASTALGGSVWIIVGWPPRRRPRFGPG